MKRPTVAPASKSINLTDAEGLNEKGRLSTL
jgi:hypothetical protein